jgi:hypothetical protein
MEEAVAGGSPRGRHLERDTCFSSILAKGVDFSLMPLYDAVVPDDGTAERPVVATGPRHRNLRAINARVHGKERTT